MRVDLIQVPYMIGDDRHGSCKGPQRLLDNGLEQLFAARGIPVRLGRIERPTPFRDSTSSSVAVNKQLAARVRQSIAAGQVPVVLAGSCDASIGILAGFDHSRCGIIWFDAHGDFNTPESTITGFFAGMSLAVLVGHCYLNLWAQIGDNSPVQEDATLLLGVRDLDPAERDRLERSAVRVVSWERGKPNNDVASCLNELAHRVPEIYLHIDVDALDPEVAPGIVDHPVPGGISLSDMEESLRAITSRFRIKAACLATYNPDTDGDKKTLRAILQISDLMAEHLRETR